MQEYTLKIEPKEGGKRLDLILADFSQRRKLGISRTYIQKLIRENKIKILGQDKIKPHYRVRPGDKIKISFKEKQTPELLPENIPLNIVYEDRDLAIINKPTGMVVHPAPGNYQHTLVNALLYHFKKLSDINPKRPGIVHRLDKETSGLLVVAKNNTAHLTLCRQFARHSIKRKYIALVKGKVEFQEDIIEIPIGRHPEKRKEMAAGFGRNIKSAKTYYHTLKRSSDKSLLELEPYTGRTHQLRVHLAYLGHPILGDTKYGKNNLFFRLALHARYLGFIHPASGKFVEFTCAIPQEFTQALD